MLFRIKLISDEVDGFLREYKIDSEATFLDLNKAVLASCGYPDDQMTSFYMCDEEWQRGEQITREDMETGSADEDIYVMEKTRLSDFIEDEDQRLEFVFDPFSDRCFYLDVVEVLPGEHLSEAAVVRAKGEAPVQIEAFADEILAVAPAAAGKKGGKGAQPVAGEEDDFDDAFYGGSDFAGDDFDFDGFEISEGKPY